MLKDICQYMKKLSLYFLLLLLIAATNVFAFDIETPKGKKTLAIANPTVPEVNAIKKELEEFSSAIINNTKTIVSEIDGLMAMDVAHQILKKIGNNTIVR